MRTLLKATAPLWTLLVPVAVGVLLVVVVGQMPDGRLHLWVLDVGQGDALFLKTPGGHTALIDSGPGATPLLNGIGERVPFWRHELDLLALTHPHGDHITGLVEVLGRYKVDQVVQTEFTATSAVQGEWLRAIEARNIPIHHAKRGETISFEGEPDVELRVLHPSSGDVGGEANPNSDSIVLKLSYGKHDILLTGDIEDEAEAELIRHEGDKLQSEVLKVAHHGSNTSSTPGFIRLVAPQIAIISVGADNRFGHPSPATLETLQQAGTQIYRTDTDGTVEIVADKEQMWVRSER